MNETREIKLKIKEGLKSLEANGFVSFIKRKQKGKNMIIAVEATDKTRLTIQGISGHLLSVTLDDVDYMAKIFGEIIKNILAIK